MNKSKFLKKSLAMLLALMLVLAMIPLSASAAEAYKVWVAVNENGGTGTPEEAEGSNGAYSYSIVEPGPSDTVTISVSVGDEGGDVRFMDANGIYNEATTPTGTGTFAYTIKAPVAEGEYNFAVFTNAQDKEPDQECTLALSFTEPEADTGVETVSVDGCYDVIREGNDFTVVLPYGQTAGTVKVTTTGDNSTVATPAATKTGGVWVFDNTIGLNDKTSFTVVAENTTQEASYTVTLVQPKPFATFAVEGQRHTSQISRVTEDIDFVNADDTSDHTIEVYLPFGATVDANHSFEFTPVFEVNYNVVITAKDRNTNNTVEIKSGETYDANDFVDLSSVSAGQPLQRFIIPLTVTYSEGTTESWDLDFDGITPDPVAAIKELRKDNYVATIEGSTITLSLPASQRVVNGTLTLDTTSKVEIVNYKKDNVSAGGSTITGVDLTRNSYQLRVTAAGPEFDATTPEVKNYTLNIVTVAEQAPQMNTMTLQKADGTGRIEADIDHDKNTITFEVPFGAGDLAYFSGGGYKLFWTATNGATVTYNNGTPIKKSGASVSEVAYNEYLPNGNHTNGKFNGQIGQAASQPITVAIGDATEEYTVIFKNALPNTNSTLGTVELAEADETVWDSLTDAEKLTATVTAPVNGGKGKITAEIPYGAWSDYNATNAGPVFVTTLPEGAELFYRNVNGALTPIDELNEDTATITKLLVQSNGTNYDYADSYSNTADGKKPLDIYVLSEALTEKTYTVSSLDADTTAHGLYSIYQLTLTQAKPRQTTEITSFAVYDHYTGNTSATATIGNGVITLTVPYYFTDSDRPSEDNLFLDFGVQGGETLKVNGSTVLKDLALNQDGDVVVGDSTRVTLAKQADGSYKLAVNNVTFDEIAVTAEDPTVDRVNDYDLVVKVAEPNTGAVLNSVTLAGVTATPDAKKNVNITVPLGTEVTKLAPEFDVSTNAYVTDDKNQIVKEGDTYNFYSARKFTVHAEDDSKATNTYTITVTVSDKFYDVAEDKWYYEEVMEAAGLGWINGSNGYFKPEDSMKRGDFALIIARIMGYDETQYRDSAFPDVDSDLYYSAAIAFCAEEGIIGGDGSNFYPERAITREEMAKIICNAAGVEQVTDPDSLYADDAEIAEWAKGYVYGCQAAEIMMGDESANTFDARSNATRAEAAAVLVRAFANA
ncbi:MAG TPA: S-layer homology domain-containing protein [Candidatus Acutalibacter stercorigallinarum]|nr:S-layer homology domain-containing protein [Candidatus Acutalibacter stercorigallinarum]